MLFVKIWLASVGLIAHAHAEIRVRRARLGDPLILRGHEPRRGAGITPGPRTREQRGREQEEHRDCERNRALADASPVAVRDERTHRAPPRFGVVDEMTGLGDERFEPAARPDHSGIGGGRTRGRPPSRGSGARAPEHRRVRGVRASGAIRSRAPPAVPTLVIDR